MLELFQETGCLLCTISLFTAVIFTIHFSFSFSDAALVHIRIWMLLAYSSQKTLEQRV